MASGQHFADSVCKIRRVVPTVSLSEQKVATGLDGSGAEY